MKVEKVIGTGTIHPCAGDAHYVRWNDTKVIYPIPQPDLPIGTPIKLVAEVDVERKMIRTEGAVWLVDARSHIHCTYLVIGKKVIGDAYIDGLNRVSWGIFEKALFGTVDTLEAAQLATEHSLADAGLYGFSWEEPHYERYVYSDAGRTSLCEDYTEACKQRSKRNACAGQIYGMRGELVELARWPEAEGETDDST